jgi:predicted transglutaminase-like cysteine proteinase
MLRVALYTANARILCAAALVACGVAGVAPSAGAQNLTGSDGVKTVAAPKAFASACDRIGWLCANNPASPRAPHGADRLRVVRDVNAQVNAAVAPLTDPENYGSAEYWTLPASGRGDCEDYALEKYRRLLDAGFPSSDLRLAVALDRNRDNHVVLVVHHDGTDLVLDNLSHRVLPWNATEYTYLAMQLAGERDRWEVVTDRGRNSAMLAAR